MKLRPRMALDAVALLFCSILGFDTLMFILTGVDPLHQDAGRWSAAVGAAVVFLFAAAFSRIDD